MQHELSLVAIDLAKKIFHLVGADTTGKMLWRRGEPASVVLRRVTRVVEGAVS
jgi:hypothetical protein